MPRKTLPPEALAFFVKMGKLGGAKGGRARAANMTDEQRSESARNAVNARWGRKEKSVPMPPQGSAKISKATALVVDKDAADQAKAIADHARFLRLVAQWKTDTSTLSSITEMVLHPAYQSIIGMGDTAVAFILSQIESEGDDPDQWFWALQSITGADPVPAEDSGNYNAMAQAWLNWGRDANYEW